MNSIDNIAKFIVMPWQQPTTTRKIIAVITMIALAVLTKYIVPAVAVLYLLGRYIYTQKIKKDPIVSSKNKIFEENLKTQPTQAKEFSNTPNVNNQVFLDPIKIPSEKLELLTLESLRHRNCDVFPIELSDKKAFYKKAILINPASTIKIACKQFDDETIILELLVINPEAHKFLPLVMRQRSKVQAYLNTATA